MNSSRCKSLFSVLMIAFFYIAFSLYLLNIRLVFATLFGPFSAKYKFALLSDLLAGFFTTLSPTQQVFSFITALLVGINIALIIKAFSKVKQNGKVQLSFGGASVLGIVTTGCASCGFSLLSLVGLSTAVSSLPFKGNEVRVIAVTVLAFSALYTYKKLQEKTSCKRK